MTAEPLPRGQRTTTRCRNGHDLTGPDPYVLSRITRDGKRILRCRLCAKETDARWRARRAALAQGTTIPDGADLQVTRHSFYRPRVPTRRERRYGPEVAATVASGNWRYEEDRPLNQPTMLLLGVLPEDLAGHVAGILMHPPSDDPVTLAQLGVIRRATTRPAFQSTPPSLAVALWVQAIMDDVADAEADYLRLDRLLALVLV